jgi:hypothetical protein
MRTRPTLIAAGGYQARDAEGRDLGRATAYRSAILWAERAGTGSIVVATDDAGRPLTRDDGSEFIAYTVS